MCGCRRGSYEHGAAAFFSFRKRTGEPKPASTQRHRSPSRAAYRQAEPHSELFTKDPLQGLHLQRTKQTNGVMYRQREVVFPLSEQSLTLQNTFRLLTRNQSGNNASLQQSTQRPWRRPRMVSNAHYPKCKQRTDLVWNTDLQQTPCSDAPCNSHRSAATDSSNSGG